MKTKEVQNLDDASSWRRCASSARSSSTCVPERDRRAREHGAAAVRRSRTLARGADDRGRARHRHRRRARAAGDETDESKKRRTRRPRRRSPEQPPRKRRPRRDDGDAPRRRLPRRLRGGGALRPPRSLRPRPRRLPRPSPRSVLSPKERRKRARSRAPARRGRSARPRSALPSARERAQKKAAERTPLAQERRAKRRRAPREADAARASRARARRTRKSARASWSPTRPTRRSPSGSTSPAVTGCTRRSSASRRTLHAHDERNEANAGDTVRVVESRPLSRTKRWRLVEVAGEARRARVIQAETRLQGRRQHRCARAPLHPRARRLAAPLRRCRRHDRRHGQEATPQGAVKKGEVVRPSSSARAGSSAARTAPTSPSTRTPPC